MEVKMSDSKEKRKLKNGGKLLILSGPSGVGKSTCVKRLLETCSLPLELSVSATTRPKRPDEVDGRHYNFCLLYTSPSPRDRQKSRMPSSA